MYAAYNYCGHKLAYAVRSASGLAITMKNIESFIAARSSSRRPLLDTFFFFIHQCCLNISTRRALLMERLRHVTGETKKLSSIYVLMTI